MLLTVMRKVGSVSSMISPLHGIWGGRGAESSSSRLGGAVLSKALGFGAWLCLHLNLWGDAGQGGGDVLTCLAPAAPPSLPQFPLKGYCHHCLKQLTDLLKQSEQDLKDNYQAVFL